MDQEKILFDRVQKQCTSLILIIEDHINGDGANGLPPIDVLTSEVEKLVGLYTLVAEKANLARINYESIVTNYKRLKESIEHSIEEEFNPSGEYGA